MYAVLHVSTASSSFTTPVLTRLHVRDFLIHAGKCSILNCGNLLVNLFASRLHVCNEIKLLPIACTCAHLIFIALVMHDPSGILAHSCRNCLCVRLHDGNEFRICEYILVELLNVSQVLFHVTLIPLSRHQRTKVRVRTQRSTRWTRDAPAKSAFGIVAFRRAQVCT